MLRLWWIVRRPDTYGVKLVLRHGEQALFVRHTYGDRRAWDLPGGGRRRGETPAETARREGAEELGLDIADWEEVGEIVVEFGATAHMACLVAEHDGRELTIARGEIGEARWCVEDDPPQPLAPHAAKVLARVAEQVS